MPLVGVGLLYRSGYFRQTVDADGFQQHIYPDYDFARLPVLPGARRRAAACSRCRSTCPAASCRPRSGRRRSGSCRCCMLDTDIPLERSRRTARSPASLYVRGREMRLCQEIVLGIGGVRALRALGHPPGGLAHERGPRRLPRPGARARARAVAARAWPRRSRRVTRNTVFTTHTPVPAGNETFDRELVKRYLGPWMPATSAASPTRRWPSGADDGSFNLTVLAIRLASSVNGVSKLHGQVSSAMWRHLWPGLAGQPVGHVTNGVHTAELDRPRDARALRAPPGRRTGSTHLLEPDAVDAGRRPSPTPTLWAAHRSQKERLVRFVRERVRVQSARHGLSPDELRGVEGLLDPEALTIGFARRFATYKRAVPASSRDLDRLRALLDDTDRPVQIVFAGKAHPADRAGKELIRQLFAARRRASSAGKLVFLEDYDMDVGRMLVQGVRRLAQHPAPAAGGQRHQRHEGAASTAGSTQHPRRLVGGGLPRRQRLGHRRGEPAPTTEEQDRADAASLYQLLEEEMVPALLRAATPTACAARWIATMKAPSPPCVPQFSAHRMVRDYVGDLPARRRRRLPGYVESPSVLRFLSSLD